MSPQGQQPNFFIIGAPKCGTTALSEYVRSHPNVFMTDPKEPNFFDRDLDYYLLGDPDSYEGYLRLYRDALPQHTARGEASVWYLHSKVAAERIHAIHPDARLIAMVRDPVQLVQSLHAHLLYTHQEDVEDFETAWKLQEERAQGRCLPANVRDPAFYLEYAEIARVSVQLERFLECFSRDQLLVIVFDDFRRDAGACYRAVLEHIGVEDDGRTDFAPVNQSKVHRWQWLSNLTQRPPGPALAMAHSMKSALGIDRLGILERVRSVNRELRKREPLDEAFEAELRRGFEPEVRALSRLLGRNLDAWIDGESVPEEPSR